MFNWFPGLIVCVRDLHIQFWWVFEKLVGQHDGKVWWINFIAGGDAVLSSDLEFNQSFDLLARGWDYVISSSIDLNSCFLNRICEPWSKFRLFPYFISAMFIYLPFQSPFWLIKVDSFLLFDSFCTSKLQISLVFVLISDTYIQKSTVKWYG